MGYSKSYRNKIRIKAGVTKLLIISVLGVRVLLTGTIQFEVLATSPRLKTTS